MAICALPRFGLPCAEKAPPVVHHPKKTDSCRKKERAPEQELVCFSVAEQNAFTVQYFRRKNKWYAEPGRQERVQCTNENEHTSERIDVPARTVVPNHLKLRRCSLGRPVSEKCQWSLFSTIKQQNTRKDPTRNPQGFHRKCQKQTLHVQRKPRNKRKSHARV